MAIQLFPYEQKSIETFFPFFSYDQTYDLWPELRLVILYLPKEVRGHWIHEFCFVLVLEKLWEANSKSIIISYMILNKLLFESSFLHS